MISRPHALPLMDRLADLADPIRARILLALESHPLTVSELQATLQLPQSTVSRHLRVLGEGAWVAARPDGPSHRYRFLRDALPQDRQRLWALVREELASTRAARGDAQRLHTVLTRRHARARRFFASEATRWDALRTELFGPRLELLALLGMLEPDWVVGDLGCGTGPLSAAVAPFVHRVVAVDESAEMLAAARARLAGFDQVEIREGELELLPVNEAELDLAVLALVLPYLPEPARVIAEAARALEAGGRLLVVDLTAHDRSELEERMGHLWPGFEESQMLEWMTAAGLVGGRVRPLPQDPEAKGPALFVATARKPTDRGHATP